MVKYGLTLTIRGLPWALVAIFVLVRPVVAPRVDPGEVRLRVPPAAETVQPRLPAGPFTDIIERVSARHGVDPILIHAVIGIESSYRPRARSPKGAMGLMQLMPATARRYSVSDPFDPEANIEGGTRYLKWLLEEFEVSHALAAYNAGEISVRKFGGIPPYRETRRYVARVLELVDTVKTTASDASLASN